MRCVSTNCAGIIIVYELYTFQPVPAVNVSIDEACICMFNNLHMYYLLLRVTAVTLI